MMHRITINNVPDEIYTLLQKRAAANHRSINDEILSMLDKQLNQCFDVVTTIHRLRELRKNSSIPYLNDKDLKAMTGEGR